MVLAMFSYDLNIIGDPQDVEFRKCEDFLRSSRRYDLESVNSNYDKQNNEHIRENESCILEDHKSRNLFTEDIGMKSCIYQNRSLQTAYLQSKAPFI